VIQWKSDEVKRLGGIGMVLVDDESMDLSFIDPSFLVTIIKPEDGIQIMSYINSTRFKMSHFTRHCFQTELIIIFLPKKKKKTELIYHNPYCREPIATIMPTRSRTGHMLAPSIPSFSSRGPYLLTRSILKV